MRGCAHAAAGPASTSAAADDREEPPDHETSFSAARNCDAKLGSVDRAGEVGDDLPVRVEDVRLGHLRDPVAARDAAGAVVEHRERQAVRADERPRLGVEVVVVDADELDAAAPVAQPVPLEHRAPPPCTACTTTPRSSRRPDGRAATRATRSRGRRAARSVNAGAGEPTGGACCWCVSFQTSSASSPATHARATTCATSFTRPVTTSAPRGGSGRDPPENGWSLTAPSDLTADDAALPVEDVRHRQARNPVLPGQADRRRRPSDTSPRVPR